MTIWQILSILICGPLFVVTFVRLFASLRWKELNFNALDGLLMALSGLLIAISFLGVRL